MRTGFFTFVILRYTHDAVAGESVNVGLVAHHPTSGEIKFRLRTSMGRVRQLFPDVERRAFISGLAGIRRTLAAQARVASANDMFALDDDAQKIAIRALPRDDSAFQWSQLGRGVADDIAREFDELYSRLVARYDGEPRLNRTDDAIWKPVRDRLLARDVKIDFSEKSIEGETDQVTFAHAWKNGQWHAYQPVSLDLMTPENILDKARRWRGQMVGVAEGAQSDRISLNFILGKPQDPSLLDAYEHAKAIFNRMPLAPKVFSEDELSTLVDEIESEYRAHGEASAGSD